MKTREHSHFTHFDVFRFIETFLNTHVVGFVLFCSDCATLRSLFILCVTSSPDVLPGGVHLTPQYTNGHPCVLQFCTVFPFYWMESKKLNKLPDIILCRR